GMPMAWPSWATMPTPWLKMLPSRQRRMKRRAENSMARPGGVDVRMGGTAVFSVPRARGAWALVSPSKRLLKIPVAANVASVEPSAHATDPPRRSRGRPRKTADERDDGNRRQALLRAAARLFRQNGFAATRTRDIAAAVGMRSGSP